LNSTCKRCLQVAALVGFAVLAGCTKPQIVKEPYKVTEVREVYRPIPDEYTRTLDPPQLPDTITVLDLVNHIKAWQAWGKVALKRLTNDP
jgi:hypothetical protein